MRRERSIKTCSIFSYGSIQGIYIKDKGILPSVRYFNLNSPFMIKINWIAQIQFYHGMVFFYYLKPVCRKGRNGQ